MKRILKNGLVATKNGFERVDILLQGEIIKNISENIPVTDEKVYDLSNKIIIPGGIDVHTHFNIDVGIKSVDDFYSGGVAAAFGGTTTVIDHPGFGPKGCSLDHQISIYEELGKKSPIDYSFHGVIQHISEDLEKELESLKAKGINSFKLYMTYMYALKDSEIIEVLSLAKKLDIIICVHGENNEIIEHLRGQCKNSGNLSPINHAYSRPDYSESEAVSRLLSLGRATDFSKLYFVHISCKKSLDLLKEARENGEKFFVESCPQYLFLTEEKYLREDGVNFILSPPLRKVEDNRGVLKSIHEGVIDIVGTDHCTFSLEDKKKGASDFTVCPNGIPGVQERVPLMFSEVLKGNISIQNFLDTCCKNPAKIFGIDHLKGEIKEGLHGDLVVLSLNKSSFSKENIKSKAGYSCYSEIESLVSIDKVFIRGEILIENGEIKEKEGKFLKRK